MNTQFHAGTYVERYLSASISHCRLAGPEGGGSRARLSNQNCVIELEIVDNDYVRFEFWRPDEPNTKWELAEYLNCRFMELGGAFKLRPKPKEELSNKEKVEWYLQRYDEVLVLGYFEAPLNGDYSWAEAYEHSKQEYRRLSSALLKLMDAGHPEGKRLFGKQLQGDRSWMAEVREILGEQNREK